MKFNFTHVRKANLKKSDSSSLVALWKRYKIETGVAKDNLLSIADFKNFAKILVQLRYKSTNNYLSAAVNYEIQRKNVHFPFFERDYKYLRRRVQCTLEALGPAKKARPYRIDTDSYISHLKCFALQLGVRVAAFKNCPSVTRVGDSDGNPLAIRLVFPAEKGLSQTRTTFLPCSCSSIGAGCFVHTHKIPD